MFHGKVVAITGAAGGIGQALCRHFGKDGAAIAAIDKSPAIAQFSGDLRAEGVRVAHSEIDIADADAVARGFARLQEQLGPVDILVNNAGFSRFPTIESTSPADWRHDV